MVEAPESGSPVESTDEVRVVLVTAPNTETAEVLAREMVEERLAACASVVPGLTSFFWWEGEVQRDQEALVVLKTGVDAVASLRERVVDLHPYEVPEFLALPVYEAFPPYLRWILEETDPSARSAEE